MSRPSRIPLVLAVLVPGGLLTAGILTRRDNPPPPLPVDAEEQLSEPAAPFVFVSHDWIETTAPVPEKRESLLPAAAGADMGIVDCTLPTCRNCQIHRIWRDSF